MKTAEQILRDNDYVNRWNEVDPGLISILQDYAQQFIDEAANLVDDWENSGTFREGILEELNPQNK